MSSSKPLKGSSVAIVGAGLAGLTAAWKLTARGAQVRVFEARNRPGGRVWTIRGGPLGAFHAEAGGELIEGEHQEIRQVARELGLPLTRVLRGGFGLSLSGPSGRRRLLRTQTGPWRALERTLAPLIAAFRGAEEDWNSETAARLAARSFADTLRQRQVQHLIRQLAIAFRGFYLADPSDVSTLVVVEQLLADGNPGAVEMFRIRGGNDRLVGALGQAVGPHRIELGHAVTRLARDERGVRLVVRDAAGHAHDYSADYAVITAPAPLVLSIELDPALPELQRRALESLTYGCATKLLLRFDRPWWRRRGRPNAYGTDLPIGAVWDAAEDQKGAALLTLLAGGSASKASRQLLAEEGTAGILQQLRWLGRPDDPLTEPRVIVWEDDPWAGGGYAYFSPRFEPSLRTWLPRGSGRLLFAGEHTSEKSQGYMNGAVESGLRAANEIESLQRLAQWEGT